MKSTKKYAIAAVVVAGALAFAQTPSFAAGSAAAAQLPASVKKAGVLNVGTDTTYAPNEYLDKNGKAIGWEIDLLNAVAADLGVKTKFVSANFDSIIPGIKGGKYDIGLSSFTDTKVREAQVDFANYYVAGIQWASAAGKPAVDPNNACGLTVSAQTGSTEVDDLAAKSAACVKAGKKPITTLSFDDQNQASNAVSLGRAQAISADSPVTEDVVHRSAGRLQLDGAIYGSAPYGMATAKGSTLVKAISLALQDLYKNGTYGKILAKWGVTPGAVKSFTVDGAIN
jgi:polar amino acid transport system substrate-binding protein